ncbi:type IV secretory system conjugative DNA transfer family protein [Rhizobium leguminosarum]|uniref:TraM recognition domain-containing protein n=1 Tax=Rhizobium leguminosarum TaxID=384 RepID=A0A7K3VDY8_RHILE|nr:type IV secretory system conjugative DNA transfer family protein [Rhizobium leguminosarum]NEK15037.1 TraM recognition domain-containing protein [Rhizobium leguminosarum]
MTDDSGKSEKFPKVSDKGAETAKRLASEGWGTAKRLGGFLKQKAEEKIGDTRQRLAEPQLTAEEQDIIRRYRAIAQYLPADHLTGHPPLPAESMFNRRDIRQFLASPKIPELLAQGDTAFAAAEAARLDLEARAEAARIEEEAKAAADRARTLEAQMAEIDKFYANTLNEVKISISQLRSVLPANAISQAGDLAFEGSRSAIDKNWLASPQSLTDVGGGVLYKALRKGSATDAVEGSYFQRSLVSMTEPERAALRLADILLAAGAVSKKDILKARTPIVWNKGECLITIDGNYGGNLRKREAAMHALKSLISTYFGEPATGTETIKAHLARIMEPGGENPTIQRVLERYIVGGSRWMMPAESSAFLPKNVSSPTALRLGRFSDNGPEFMYDMNESLITVAAPGTGKSQGHVLRNLLYLEAPAVVLDIKGEMRDLSAGWRQEAVGPVHIFAPTTPAASLHYNPLDFIENDLETAWDAARKLADLLVIPTQQKGGDTYFEDRARDMITTAVLDVALSEEGAKRTMTSVLDRLYLSDDTQLVAWFEHLESLNVSQLRRQASALKGMPQKQREGILDSARRQLEIWQSPAIERLTGQSTFSADRLRLENGTLYLCVALDDIKKYASVLRVIIGQTVQQLCRAAPEAGSRTVTFFLDELPRLGRMDVIEEALDVGRGFGVRLWMFCQNTGQLETAYPNAAGMMKSCAIRAFMNPDEHTAHQLSQNLGTRETLLDASRKPLAEASQLAGPDFADKVIVFGRSSYAAKLNKVFAYSDPVTKERMRPGE